MGIVFGMTGSAEPSFSVVPSGLGGAGELRMYQPFIVAEVLKPRGSDEGFSTLARYIGVFGDPQNEGKTPMAMTAPVTLTPAPPQKMAMTSPVTLTPSGTEPGHEYMGFVLPFEITRVDQAPRPLDKRITLRAVPARLVAVRTYSGWHSDAGAKAQYKTLHAALLRDELVTCTPGSSVESDDVEGKYSVSQSHPPFTLPFLRRNEVWVEIQQSLPAVKKLLAAAAAAATK